MGPCHRCDTHLSLLHDIMTTRHFCLSLAARHAGDYYLFESESEDEEELQSEEQKPAKQTACQVRPSKYARVYHRSWSYNTKTWW